MKYFFRYKRSDFFVLMSFFVSVLCLGVVFYYNGTRKHYLADRERASFRNEMAFSVAGYETTIDLELLLSGIQGNIKIYDWPVQVESSKGAMAATIIYSESEPSKTILRSGGVRPENTAAPCVVLGTGTKRKLCADRNSITLDMEQYQIVGEAGSSVSDYDNYNLILYYDNLAPFTRDRLNCATGLNIFIGSDIISDSMLRDQIMQNIEENTLEYSINFTTRSEYGEDPGTTQKKVRIYILLFLYALVTCFTAISFWLYERKTETIIRITFIGNRKPICFQYFVQLMKYLVLSWATGIAVLFLWFHSQYGRNFFQVVSGLGFVVSFLIICVSAFIYLMVRIEFLFQNASITDAAKAGGDL